MIYFQAGLVTEGWKSRMEQDRAAGTALTRVRELPALVA